ncbi:hypothetical protein EXA21_15660 [Vibrio cincinnatiensis]|nr:hypothetical protein [Vibrio cincinnatiensis]MCG3764217.1 hypothetical protein [Vibrio cincinnatiensis]
MPKPRYKNNYPKAVLPPLSRQFCIQIFNAALSGEQRIPLHLKYCAVNTKDEANQKWRALAVPLEPFVERSRCAAESIASCPYSSVTLSFRPCLPEK